jgi:hypothetical protein
MLILKPASPAFLFLVLFLNNHEHQAAIGALFVLGANGGSTCRAPALADQFVGSPELRMYFPVVFRNTLLCPFKVLFRYDQHALGATAFVTAGIGSDRAGDTGIDKSVVQFTQPLQVALPYHDRVFNRLLHQPLLFLLCLSVLLVQKEDRAAIRAFSDMRQIFHFAIRTYLIPVHSPILTEPGIN